MAFNWQTFKTRTLTAILFVVVMLVGLLWNRWSFLVLFSIIHFGCWWEYLRLMEKIHSIRYHPYIKLGLMVMGYGLMLWFCGPSFKIYGYGLRENISLPVSVAGFVVLVTGIFQKGKVDMKSFGSAFLGIVYISLSWALMISFLYEDTIDIHLHDTMYVIASIHIPVVIIASIWINDTMAYIVGSLIGKTPISKISPKKTWEGTIGGIILSILVTGLLLPFIFLSEFNLIISTIIGLLALICAISGTFGDLLESKLKRMAGVKDSGHIMPGHGGFLDRFDSLLLAIPAVWIVLIVVLGVI